MKTDISIGATAFQLICQVGVIYSGLAPII